MAKRRVGILFVAAGMVATPAGPAVGETVREPIRTFKGHSDEVTDVAFSPDGELVLTGLDPAAAILWDRRTGQRIRTFMEEGYHEITSVAFSPNGEFVLTGSSDGSAKLWDAGTGEKLRILQHIEKNEGEEDRSSRVYSAFFLRDGKYILTSASSTKLWKTKTGSLVVTYPKAGGEAIFSPDGNYFLSESYGKHWSTKETGKLRISTKSKSEPVWKIEKFDVDSFSFSPSGKTFVSGGDDSIKVFDAATGRKIRTIVKRNSTDFDVKSIQFSPTGQYILSGHDDGIARLWDVQTGEKVRTFRHSPDEDGGDWVNSVAFSPDGEHVLTGGVDETAKLWASGLEPIEVANTSPPSNDIGSGKTDSKTDGESTSTTTAEPSNNTGKMRAKLEKIQEKLERLQAQQGDGGQRAAAPIPEPRSNPQTLSEKVAALDAAPKDDSRHLFAIGISDYANAQDVVFAERSTKLAVQAMQKRLGIPEVNSTVLTGQKATGTQIIARMKVFLNRIDSGDRIYFYYAGHGAPARDGSGAYILGSDAIIQAYQIPQLSLNTIYERFQESQAERVVAFIDSCFSGRTDGNELVFDDQDVAPFTKASNVEPPEDVTVFTAGANDQFASSYRDKKHRLFSYYLIDGLVAGRDDLASYVRERVYEHSRRNGPTYTQKPQLQGSLVLN